MRNGLALSAIALLWAVPATAQNLDLDFTSLPSAQGWSYSAGGSGAPFADTDIFSVDGTHLYQNTMGIPMDVAGGNYYFHGATLAPSNDFTLDVTAALRASEGLDFGSGPYPFGFIFGLQSTYFGLGATGFASYSNGEGVQYHSYTSGFNALAEHDYRITRSGALVTLTADGTTLFSGNLTGAAGSDLLLLGDGTGFGNASGYITRYTFITDVPEPASWAMMIGGFGLIGGAMRRRQRVSVRFA